MALTISRLATTVRSCLFALAFVTPFNCTALQAQTPANPPPAPPAPAASAPAPSPAAASTLELPVLVTDHEHRPVDDVHLDKLSIKLGSAPAFAPSAMRHEGNDPLSLAILIDASRDSWHDLSQVGAELASLVGPELLPDDRISLYVADCTMTRSLNNAAPDAAALRKAVADAFAFPSLHGGKSGSACGKSVHLWDDVSVAVAALSHAPARRAILLISSGADGGSKYDWLTVQQYAFDQGVAIFALRDKRQADADDFTRTGLSVKNGYSGAIHQPTAAPRSANNLELLCANDGGLTLTSSPEFRKDGIADILFLIRSRYILTVPKGAYQSGTGHSAKITQVGLTPYFITATGATDPLASK